MQERRESTSAKREEEQVVEPGDVLLLLLRLRCRLLGVQEGGGKFRGHTWQGGGEGEVLEVAFTTVLTEATATQNEAVSSSSLLCLFVFCSLVCFICLFVVFFLVSFICQQLS